MGKQGLKIWGAAAVLLGIAVGGVFVVRDFLHEKQTGTRQYYTKGSIRSVSKTGVTVDGINITYTLQMTETASGDGPAVLAANGKTAVYSIADDKKRFIPIEQLRANQPVEIWYEFASDHVVRAKEIHVLSSSD